MLFLILLFYIVVSYVYPGEIFPALAPYRLTFWTGVTGLMISLVWLLRRAAPLKSPQLWFLGIFTIVLALSRIVNEGYLGAVVPTLNAFGPSLAMFVLTISSVDSLRKMKLASTLIAGLSVILVLQGFAAYHFGWNTQMFLFDPYLRLEYNAAEAVEEIEQAPPPSETEESDVPPEENTTGASTEYRIRGLGLMHDPNDLALGLVFAVPLLGIYLRRNSAFRNLLLVGLPAAALTYGIYLTHSRGGTLALVVALGYAASRKFGRLPAVILICTLGAAAMAIDFAGGRALVGSDESVSGRIDAWSEGLQMLRQQPFLGVGYGQFLDHHTLTAHNSFVLCFAETGLIGYFFWLGIILMTLFQLHSLKTLPGQEPMDVELRRWATVLQVSMVGFLTAAFFLSRTFVPMLYLLVGLAVALSLIARQQNRPVWFPSMPRLATLIVASEVVSIVLIYLTVRLRLI